MHRRTLLKTVGAAGLLGLGAGTAASSSDGLSPQGCNFRCCEDCRIAYCPNGCDCDGYCDGQVRLK